MLEPGIFKCQIMNRTKDLDEELILHPIMHKADKMHVMPTTLLEILVRATFINLVMS
jgi:hypothetical protein